MDRTDPGMCTATLFPDPMNVDAAQFAAVVRATVDAGIGSISLWPFHAATLGDEAAGDLLADSGLAVRVVEAAVSWIAADPDRTAHEAGTLLDAAGRFGATTLLACTMAPEMDSLDRAAEGFALLCAAAAERDVRVALEFLPWSAIPDLATGWQVVEKSGAPNGGLVIDTWHWTRQPGGPDLGLLRQIPGERIHYLQLCDAAARPDADVLAETMTARLLPGEGVADFGGLFAVLEDIGATPYLACEVFNRELAAAGPAAMASQVRDATAAMLAGLG